MIAIKPKPDFEQEMPGDLDEDGFYYLTHARAFRITDLESWDVKIDNVVYSTSTPEFQKAFESVLLWEQLNS